MVHTLIKSTKSVTLVGGGEFSAPSLVESLKRAPVLVAADGGADHVLEAGAEAELVIGDLDSLSARARAQIPEDRLALISEQDSTDFEKALSRIDAPLIYGLGFTGKRIDHELAVYATLARYTQKRCIIVGQEDVCAHVPWDITLTLPVGTRLSLFPMGPVKGRSSGLKWDIEGIEFAPRGQIGTSNETTQEQVSLHFDGPGMLLILPRAYAEVLATALLAAA